MSGKSFRWRAMTASDLDAVEAIAVVVHPGFFERRNVLGEKQRLYPEGAWFCEIDREPCAYLLSHPWCEDAVPALDTLLEAIPTDTDTYYLHDLALLPEARGFGAGLVVRMALEHAANAGHRIAALVAVNYSVEFWGRHGFAVVDVPHLADKLRAYEPAARLMRRALSSPARAS